MADKKRLIDAKTAYEMGHRTPFHIGIADLCDLKELLEDVPTVDAVVLPCKIGDKVYRINEGNYYSGWKPFVQEMTVTEISWKKEKYGDKDLGFAIIANGIRYKFTSIGKSVFLSRKEAEEKMAVERRNNEKTD